LQATARTPAVDPPAPSLSTGPCTWQLHAGCWAGCLASGLYCCDTHTLLYDASAPTPEVPAGHEWHHRLFISQLSVSWFEVGGPCRPLTQPSLHCAPLALAPPRPPRQGNLPSLSAPKGRELCFLRPIHGCWCWVCQSLPACCSLASRGTRLSPTVAMPSATGSGPGLKSEKEPRCPGRQRTPANALRGLASPTPSTLAAPMALCSLGSCVGGGDGRLLCCRVCRCCCLLPGAGAGGFAPSTIQESRFAAYLGHSTARGVLCARLLTQPSTPRRSAARQGRPRRSPQTARRLL
jgi:hypothetical protein